MAIAFQSLSIVGCAISAGHQRWSGGFLIALIMAATAVGSAGAGEITPRDLRHEAHALQALQNDPKLAPLNLGVKVRNRVATLWGPVPTRQLAERAVSVVKRLPEISEVQNKLIVQFDETVYPPLALKPETAPAKPPEKDKQLPAPQPDLKPPQPQPAVGMWKPVNPEPSAGMPSVALLPLVTSQPSTTGTVSRPKDNKASESPDAAAISGAVQSLVQSEERFRRVRYEVKQGKVFLGGVVYRWADLRELSVAVTHIPGVEGVVLREVRAEPRK